MKTFTVALKAHVGEDHFPLFIERFTQAPCIRNYLPPTTTVQVAPVAPVDPVYTSLVQTALTIKNNAVATIGKLLRIVAGPPPDASQAALERSV